MKVCMLGDARHVHVRRLACGLATRGHEVTVVSRKTAELPGVVVARFAVPGFGVRHAARWSKRRAQFLKQLFRLHDIVHVNFLHDWHLTQEIVDRGRLVVTPWGSDVVKPPDLSAYDQGTVDMRRWMLRNAHGVVVHGRPFAAVVEGFAGLTRGDVSVVPLGVDVTRFHPSHRQVGCRPTVGFLKGFRAVYGPEVWISAMPEVLATFPDVHFVMIGDGPLRERCRTLAAALHVSDVVSWLDPQPHERLPEVLGRWTLSVVPSRCESFCVAALESAAMGVPVVASRVGGLVETVRDGETGLLVPPDCPDELAAGVIELLTNHARRAAMAAAGRAMVEREYAWDSCLERLEAVYARACDAAPVPA